ncbi:MAG: stage II sporulation protein R [Oscillospiraceae bacterium]|jgi:stage II sporulation protein R|nr:stage II sporulation protein R [Oscillospiraceae bacterium]
MNVQILKLSVLEKSILVGFIFSIMVSFVNFAGNCENISKKFLRFHIIANSDSIQDQELKLKVKDKIQTFFSKYNWKNLEEASTCICKNNYLIESVAKDEINNNGYKYLVKANFENNALFNTRYYDDIVLPAGRYHSLKLIIGKGEGKNFFCVLFPHMCVPASQKLESRNILEKTLDSNEIEIIENNKVYYEVKFKVLEVFEYLHDNIINFVSGFRTKMLKNKTIKHFSKPLLSHGKKLKKSADSIHSAWQIRKFKTPKNKKQLSKSLPNIF